MIVCVAGMHRSGTSLVTRLLHLCGLELGPEGELIPATTANTDGHLEHRGFVELNDQVLARLGGGWDLLPPLPPAWERESALDPLRDDARHLVAEFAGREPWGWKDPRNSLTLPFWSRLLPGLRTVVCVRNPLEVMRSLRRRGLCSYALGLSLWKIYNERILDATRPGDRVVTHYDSYFDDAAAELARVAGFLGLSLSPQILERCRKEVKADLRHSRFSDCHLREMGIPGDIVELYRGLCAEAQYAEAAGTGSDPRPPLDLPPREAESLRRNLELLGRASPSGARSDQVRKLRRKLSALRQHLASVQEARDYLRRVLEFHSLNAGSIPDHFPDPRLELIERHNNLRRVLDDLEASDQERAVSARKRAYRQLVRRVRELLQTHVPRNATIAVVNKGDEDLLQHFGRRGWHFPQDERGEFAGYYPACGLAAVAHLEVLRSRGAEYLMLPAPSSWWLTTYPEFKAHLEGRYRVAASVDETGTLYSLVLPAEDSATEEAGFAILVSRFRASHGRGPVVLDWDARAQLADRYPDLVVFGPGSTNGRLPYIDRSVEVVAVASDDPGVLAEARRVAEIAILNFSPGGGGGRGGPVVTWIRDLPELTLPTVSLIIPAYNNWRLTAGCLRAVRETLPRGFRGEIIVVDDASTDDTGEQLTRLAGQDPRVRVVRNPSNAGFVDSCNGGAEAARGEFLVFLNNDTIPLPGWLPPLLRTFASFPDAGAVGGKLLFPDGRLQEAGGLVFQDASAAHFGRGEMDASKPIFNYVREVAYCSAALLATPRQVFRELGGFDPRFRPGYYEDVDYCFRMRETGRRVYYQPDSVLMHLEGATSGTDLSQGMKRHQAVNQALFEERWRDVLSRYPMRPSSVGMDAWAALA